MSIGFSISEQLVVLHVIKSLQPLERYLCAAHTQPFKEGPYIGSACLIRINLSPCPSPAGPPACFTLRKRYPSWAFRCFRYGLRTAPCLITCPVIFGFSPTFSQCQQRWSSMVFHSICVKRGRSRRLERAERPKSKRTGLVDSMSF
jgi:hypothetical protein